MIIPQFRLDGVPKVSRVLSKTLPDAAIKALAATGQKVAQRVQRIGWLLAPRKTGKLASQVVIKRSARGLVWRVGVFSLDRGYIARFLTFGVAPHSVKHGANRAWTNASGLRTKNQSGRLHPGFSPKDFLLGPTRNMREQSQTEFRAAMESALRQANNELQG